LWKSAGFLVVFVEKGADISSIFEEEISIFMVCMEEEQTRFVQICEAYKRGELACQRGIGTLSEKTVHKLVKCFVEPDISRHEQCIYGFVADIVNDYGITEIQTANFGRLRKKLSVFLEYSVVTVIYPIASAKWLCWIDEETGEISMRRKSPKQGSIYDVSRELCRIRGNFGHPNFRLELFFMEMDEYKILNGSGRERKRGAAWYDRVPLSFTGRVCFQEKKDYLKFLPDELPENFTVKELADVIKKPKRTAQEIVTVLRDLKLIKMDGKRGRSYLYKKSVI